jgi:peptidoglycan-associated lipoprotein
MRHFALAAGLGWLLALGACAANQATHGRVAPSRAAGTAKPLEDSQYYAPSETDRPAPPESAKPARSETDRPAAPARSQEPEVMQAAYTDPALGRNAPAVEQVAVEPAADGVRAKPLVPAFPAKMEQDKLRDMKTVFFLFDKAELTPDAKQLLQANAKWMKAHPNVRVRVEGHCDERGTSEYNLALGSRRANQVRDHLIQLGVSAYALEPVSMGEEMPLKSGHDEAAWRVNRRVQFSPADSPRKASAQISTERQSKL